METPLYEFWSRIQRDRRYLNLPRAAHLFLHPLDYVKLQREIASVLSVFMRSSGRGIYINDVHVTPQDGVVTGWFVIEAKIDSSGEKAIAMHPFRCMEHEDCAEHHDLGIACMARKVFAAELHNSNSAVPRGRWAARTKCTCRGGQYEGGCPRRGDDPIPPW